MIFSKERCQKCGNKTVAVDPDNIHADYCVECGYVMEAEKSQLPIAKADGLVNGGNNAKVNETKAFGAYVYWTTRTYRRLPNLCLFGRTTKYHA